MSTQNSGPDVPVRRVDRILAFMSLGLVALSIVCFLAIIIGSAVGMDQDAFSEGLWPTVAAIPLLGLPVAFVLMLILLTMSFVRKGRAAKRS